MSTGTAPRFCGRAALGFRTGVATVRPARVDTMAAAARQSRAWRPGENTARNRREAGAASGTRLACARPRQHAPARRGAAAAMPAFGWPWARYQPISHGQSGLISTTTTIPPGRTHAPSAAATARRSATQFNGPKLLHAPSNMLPVENVSGCARSSGHKADAPASGHAPGLFRRHRQHSR